jgi:hypothetical protein
MSQPAVDRMERTRSILKACWMIVLPTRPQISVQLMYAAAGVEPKSRAENSLLVYLKLLWMPYFPPFAGRPRQLLPDEERRMYETN